MLRTYIRSCNRSQSFLLAGLHPHFDEKRRWSNHKERVERRVDNLVQSQEHLDERDEEGDGTLAGLASHRGLRVGDHKEDEELIFGSGDGGDLRLPWVAG